MGLTNYADLQATIAQYLARSDLTDQIPTFIRLAEDRLRRELRIRPMLKVATATLEQGEQQSDDCHSVPVACQLLPQYVEHGTGHATGLHHPGR